MTTTSWTASTTWRGVRCAFTRPGEDDGSGGHVLARVAYQRHDAPPALRGGAPWVGVHMTAPDDEPFDEVWRTDLPVRAGSAGDLVYAEDGEHLFCAVRVDERGVYRDAVREAYRAAFDLITRLNYPRLFRMWNLVGGIIDPNEEGEEIYRDFCVGRAEAFEEWAGRVGSIPAATGIGTRSRGVTLYFMSGRDINPVHLENPRQTPAYEYPEQYGRKSPTFARATWLGSGADSAGTLFVSGTASIVGDETVRRDDVLGQVEVTLGNIADLIGAANLHRHGLGGGYSLTDLDLVKVFVRDAADLPAVRARCARSLSPDARVVYLNVDVCRPDLLVEIEGICPPRKEG
ncbi:FkbO/Hyg5 family chorismatase [Actinosynnema sp. NPDC051121]